MASLAEVEDSLGVIAFGMTRDKTVQPSYGLQGSVFFIGGQAMLRDKVIAALHHSVRTYK